MKDKKQVHYSRLKDTKEIRHVNDITKKKTVVKDIIGTNREIRLYIKVLHC